MCLGRSWICLEWYQGTGVDYPQFLLMNEVYKLRLLVSKERRRRGLMVKPLWSQHPRGRGLPQSIRRTRKQRTQAAFCSSVLSAYLHLRIWTFLSGAAMITCVCPEYLGWPLFSIIRESCLPSKPRFLVYSVSFVSFHGHGSCNVSTAFIPDP